MVGGDTGLIMDATRRCMRYWPAEECRAADRREGHIRE